MLNFIVLADMQARMKLKAQANSLLMSYLWWVIEPLLYVFLFYTVFAVVLKSGGVDYFSLLICGMFPYLWFTKAISAGSLGIWENRGLLAQKSVPKWIFPVINVHETLYKQLWAFGIMLLALMVAGNEVDLAWSQLLFIVLLQSYLHFSLALLFATFVCLARDFIVLLEFVFMIILFSSGVFWDINTLVDQNIAELILRINPMASLIAIYRDVLLHNAIVTTSHVVNVLLMSTLILLTAVLLMRLLKKQMARRLFA